MTLFHRQRHLTLQTEFKPLLHFLLGTKSSFRNTMYAYIPVKVSSDNVRYHRNLNEKDNNGNHRQKRFAPVIIMTTMKMLAIMVRKRDALVGEPVMILTKAMKVTLILEVPKEKC